MAARTAHRDVEEDARVGRGGCQATGPAPARDITLSGAFNFRDLGGYPARDGAVVRWRRLFRSDTLADLTAEDVRLVRGLGLAAVVDLRTSTELAQDGRGPLADEVPNYYHVSVLPDEEADYAETEPEDLAAMRARYIWYLQNGSDRLARVIRCLGDQAGAPAVFHCAAGKDRTGVVAALVLGILGAPPGLIVEDYMLTQRCLAPIRERAARHPVYGKMLAAIHDRNLEMSPRTMKRFLQDLDALWGGAEGWALANGLDAEFLTRFRRSLLGN
jgi:protein-tyrosine phosphatase